MRDRVFCNTAGHCCCSSPAAGVPPDPAGRPGSPTPCPRPFASLLHQVPVIEHGRRWRDDGPGVEAAPVPPALLHRGSDQRLAARGDFAPGAIYARPTCRRHSALHRPAGPPAARRGRRAGDRGGRLPRPSRSLVHRRSASPGLSENASARMAPPCGARPGSHADAGPRDSPHWPSPARSRSRRGLGDGDRMLAGNVRDSRGVRRLVCDLEVDLASLYRPGIPPPALTTSRGNRAATLIGGR